ncbi:MAG: hypothetical protein VX733_11100 [Candidatus Latescibacterota bacterium]|nr:hypothetical protein [Candidatus Latescibacterota bacterium]
MNSEVTYTETDQIVSEFASRGLVVLSPEALGISPSVHAKVFEKELKLHRAGERVTTAAIPEVLEVINSPGVVAACNQLAGENWAIVPFTHNASFVSGGRDQHWHKDDNSPFNGRKQRHHQAVQIEMLYYPQAVREDMGPTATVPYSQYWTFNHEENHDNFAGADHLDFAYQINGMEARPVSGPDSEYDPADIVHRRTEHDARMREAVTGLGWPLVQPFEAAPLHAGSVLIYSHNTFHRGNHRRDDWRTWEDKPRFMWRFSIYRTTDPDEFGAMGSDTEIDWSELGVDPLTHIERHTAENDVTAVWRYHHHWLRTGSAPPPRDDVTSLSGEERKAQAQSLFAQIHTMGEAAEPVRIGAAYRLAAIGDDELAVCHLGKALYTERESVRRAATYGLIAAGPEATQTLVEATRSPVKWVRKAGVYGLGDASPLTEEVAQAVQDRLLEEPSVYVRSVAAGTLGCLGRRAIANDTGAELIPGCVEALIACLEREENRLAMDRAQGRSIKFCRPTDACDVCEGGANDYGLDRFEPVRSQVRENALWSFVILCSHGAVVLGAALESTISGLRQVVREDENVISVGFAMDALTRLAMLEPNEHEIAAITKLRDELPKILTESPIRSWDSLVCSGLDTQTVIDVEKQVYGAT